MHRLQHNLIEQQDFNDILQIIKEQHGYDFSGYATASLKRRLSSYVERNRIPSVFDLKQRLLNQPKIFTEMLQYLSVNVTEMFRDPLFYRTLREDILPVLASWPVIKIWHAGCATGEEVFSMAIMLQEAGLLDRSLIYGTDLNPRNLEVAASGIMPLKNMKEYTYNYIHSGGTADFSQYYTARYDNVIIDRQLLQHVSFFHHNLVADGGFHEFNLIVCRNVLIYFNRHLQNHVIDLFHQNLSPLGYMALGIKESLHHSQSKTLFSPVSPSYKIYRKV